jgi:hypothetical protein
MPVAGVMQTLRKGLLRQVRSEPKKAAALAVLVLFMGTMWARVLFWRDGRAGGPSQAGANVVGGVGRGASDTRNHVRGKVSVQLSGAIDALREWTDGPINAAERNLFHVKLDYFAKEGSPDAPKIRENGQGFWDELAKSLAVKADQEKARRILIGNLQSQASKLSLQSTVMSNGSTKAMVNGTLVEEGDTVSGFKILKIEARRMVVEREGIRLEVYFN